MGIRLFVDSEIGQEAIDYFASRFLVEGLSGIVLPVGMKAEFVNKSGISIIKVDNLLKQMK